MVGEASTGREALDVVKDQDPDVALVDFQMPDMDGIAVVHALKRDGSRTRVLLVSAITDGAIVFRALEEGAAGYLSKEAPRSELIEAVLRVARGETVIPGDLAGGIAAQIRLRAQPAARTERPRTRGTSRVCSWLVHTSAGGGNVPGAEHSKNACSASVRETGGIGPGRGRGGGHAARVVGVTGGG